MVLIVEMEINTYTNSDNKYHTKMSEPKRVIHIIEGDVYLYSSMHRRLLSVAFSNKVYMSFN
jgi:hypothetical protein